MCLKPEDTSWLPEETYRIAKAVYPQGNRVMWLRDVLGGVYKDEAFVDCYPKRGQSAEAPWRLAVNFI